MVEHGWKQDQEVKQTHKQSANKVAHDELHVKQKRHTFTKGCFKVLLGNLKAFLNITSCPGGWTPLSAVVMVKHALRFIANWDLLRFSTKLEECEKLVTISFLSRITSHSS